MSKPEDLYLHAQVRCPNPDKLSSANPIVLELPVELHWKFRQGKRYLVQSKLLGVPERHCLVLNVLVTAVAEDPAAKCIGA